ncbi:restriction endonuclease subunit S [Streptomyces sp. NPDC059373]
MRLDSFRLGEILTLERIPVDVDLEMEYDQIGIKSFGNGIFHRDPCLGSDLSKLRYFEVHPDRLIVSNIMAWEGAIGLSTESEKGFVGSARFLSYRATGDVDLRYLNYYFQSTDGRSLIRSTSTGTVARNQTLSPKNFEKATVPLPAPDEQRRIANKLDTLTAKLNAIAAASPSSESARQLAVSGLDKVLARWATGTVRLDQTCTLVNDTVHPGDDPSPAKEFVGLEHIAPHFGTRTGSRAIGDEKGRKFRFAPGDVLYGYLRPYLNKVWLSDRAGLCSVEQYVIRPNGTMPGELIAAGLRSKSTLDKVLHATHNLQLPRLRSGLLLAMEIPEIPPEHHGQAAADVNAFMHKVRHLDDRQRHRDKVLASLRPALLNAAFSGKL